MKKTLIILISLLIAILSAGCVEQTDSKIASQNLSTAADMFQLERRIVFYNGITDSYMLTIEGRCSIDPGNKILRVTCRTSETEYKKHSLGLSDNVTYFVEQLSAAQVSVYHYKVIFKPQSIIPDIDLKISQ